MLQCSSAWPVGVLGREGQRDVLVRRDLDGPGDDADAVAHLPGGVGACRRLGDLRDPDAVRDLELDRGGGDLRFVAHAQLVLCVAPALDCVGDTMTCADIEAAAEAASRKTIESFVRISVRSFTEDIRPAVPAVP